MKKKILTGITLFLYNFFVLSPTILPVYAASGFSLQAFTVSVNSGGQMSNNIIANPGDAFSLYMVGFNGSTAYSNLTANFAFSSPDFTFTNPGGADMVSKKDFATIVKSNFPVTEFNPPVLNSAVIDTAATANTTYEFGYARFKLNDNFTGATLTVTNQVTADGYAGSNSLVRVINVNVKPHILSYYFEKADGSQTTNQIQWANAEGINLVLRVKDYNGCSNIDNGTVTADLTQLGLSSTTPLIFQSCEADGKTAIFKKSGITTAAALGTKTLISTAFVAQDEDGNVNNISATYFANEDKKDNLLLEVVTPTAPGVNILSTSELTIGGPSKPSTAITFFGSQNGEIKVAVGSDGSCNGGTTVLDWTGSGSYVINSSTGVTVPATSLAEGINTVVLCLKGNPSGAIGSTNISITKDTAAPAINEWSLGPQSVTTQDSHVYFKCSEDGKYALEFGGNGTLGSGISLTSLTGTTANTNNSIVIANATIPSGTGTVWGFCQDNASNTTSKSDIVRKIPPTPSMSGAILSFADNDIDYDSIDGHDLSFTWSGAVAQAFDFFESYRVYVLPAAVSLDTATQQYTALFANTSLTGSTLDSSVTKDSTNTAFVSGGSYKVCIAIMGRSGQLWEAGCSVPSVLIADTVSHPDIVSARFIGDTSLEITTNAPLSSTLTDHHANLISYNIGGNTFTGTSILGVSNKILQVQIPSLGNKGSSGVLSVVSTGAIRANGGGFNNTLNTATPIIDGQVPTAPAFSLAGAASSYSHFYKGNITLNYTLDESIDLTKSYIKAVPMSGNMDARPYIPIDMVANETSSGSHSKVVNLDNSAFAFVSGTTYKLQLVLVDYAGNTTNVPIVVDNITYDALGPSAPSMPNFTVFGFTNPTLTWGSAIDNLGNGSGIKSYVLLVYTGNNMCSNAATTYTLSGSTSAYQFASLVNGAYSWSVHALDNLDNIGSTATCDGFDVDSNIPTITNALVTNTTLSSSQYAKNGDTVHITASIPNTDSAHIRADLSSLTGNGSDTNVLCSAPRSGITCTYAGNVVTYNFVVASSSSGVRPIAITAQNTHGTNDQTGNTSITVDNVIPQITTGITAPNGGEIWGGTTQTITWAGISDNIGINYLQFEYYNGSTWNTIGTGTNIGSYTWNVSALPSGNYKVKITAFDMVGNFNTTISTSDFFIDKTPPANPTGTITFPVNNSFLKGGATTTISWNAAALTDANGLATDPIMLEYTTDNGSHWTTISSAIPNIGTYNWNIPILNTEAGKIRLTVKDKATNITSSESAGSFIVDSISPTLAPTYAGGGGTTPQDGRYINNSGVDISGTSFDTHMSTISYLFHNTDTNQYWNGSTYTATPTWVTICSDSDSLGKAGNCNSFVDTGSLSPTVVEGQSYVFQLKAIDKALNTVTSNPVGYKGDITNPVVNITTPNNQYIDDTMTFSGTAIDTRSGISSAQISISKVQGGSTLYWNGSSWASTVQMLAATTNDGYANWSYSLPLAGENDGQSYTGTVVVYDQAFKTNNSTTQYIHFTRDTTPPSVDANVFTFTPTGIYTDGETLHVTWNPAAITATGSALATNPITLSYNVGAGPVTITGAVNIPNTGSFDFTLPVADTANARIILTAKDTLNHTSVGVLSSAFMIDSTPPSIVSVKTKGDTFGKINGLLVAFSESVDPASINIANFSVGGATISPSYVLTTQGTGSLLNLNFTTSIGDTSTTPTLTYTQGSLTDLAGKKLANTSVTALDFAEPRIAATPEFYDTNANGKIDSIKVAFSENLPAITDTASWTLGNTLPGQSIASVSTSGNFAYIILNESTNFDTAAPLLTLTFNNNGYWKDISNNLAGNLTTPTTILDKASPILVSKVTKDINGNGKMDAIDLTFSETLTGSLAGLTIANLATGATAGTTTLNANTVRIAINETTQAYDTAQIPTITYSDTTIEDSVGNKLASVATSPIIDGIAPKIISRTTQDTDGNGKIDTIVFTTSENINNNFAGITISAQGYVVTSVAAGSDAQHFVAHLQELAVSDGDNTINTQITNNTSLADSTSNNISTDASAVIAQDGVGVIVNAARYDESTKTITAYFSENFSGTLSPASFTLQGITGTYTVDSVVATTGTNTAQIILGGSPTVTYGSSAISFTTNAVGDMLGNEQSTTHFAKLAASVIINEVMFSSNVANQYIELRNLSSSSVSIAGWQIANAGVTLPGGATIPANGYYLIAHSAEGSSVLNVTPDTIDAGLVLNSTSQADLALNFGGITYDTAKASSWAAGNAATPSSMERKSTFGNGLDPANWYEAQVSVGFDDTTPKGTPKSQNQIDGAPPIIDKVSLADGALYPLSPSQIVYDYYDVGGSQINTASPTLTLKKWNGSSYDDITVSKITPSTKTNVRAIYNMASLASGKYQATFLVQDLANNQSQRVIEFYIDALDITVTNTNAHIDSLAPETLSTATVNSVVTVKTLGAGLRVSLAGSGVLTSGLQQINTWNGTHGFGVDVQKTGAQTLQDFSGVPQNAANLTLLSNAYNTGAIDLNGLQKTYVFTLKYMGKVNSTQIAEFYSGQILPKLEVSY